MSTLFPTLHNYLRVSGTRVSGVWTPTTVAATFLGSVQPAVGKDTDLVPEGRRDKGSVKVYSNTPLNVSLEGSDSSGDIIIWQGRKWEVVTALPNQNGLIPHFKYMASDAGAAV
jgi:hypothetical protein